MGNFQELFTARQNESRFSNIECNSNAIAMQQACSSDGVCMEQPCMQDGAVMQI